mgnify:CR=1 FL=1
MSCARGDHGSAFGERLCGDDAEDDVVCIWTGCVSRWFVEVGRLTGWLGV